MTAKASTAPAPSSTRASATDTPTGPSTVPAMELASRRPSAVQMAAASAQSPVTGRLIRTVSSEPGATVMVHSRLSPWRFRLARVTDPPSTSNASSRSVRKLMSGASLNAYSTSKGSPVWSLGIRVMLTVSGSGAGSTVSVAALVRLSSFPSSSSNVTRTLIRSPSSASTKV